MKFILETQNGRAGTVEFADELTTRIGKLGGKVVGHTTPPDMVVAVGGDGTMLAAVKTALRHDAPVVGFNLGTLGFLARAERDEVSEVLEALFKGDFQVEERMTVTATTGTASATGINDVVVEKVDTTRLISLAVAVDGSPFITYRADGVIVATPTGSTAYSLSARGPLVDPRLDVLVLTPVASQSLFDRALVLPSDSVIALTVVTDRVARANVDKTDLGIVGEGQSVEVRRGDHPARFVTFDGDNFPTLVRDKFGLG